MNSMTANMEVSRCYKHNWTGVGQCPLPHAYERNMDWVEARLNHLQLQIDELLKERGVGSTK